MIMFNAQKINENCIEDTERDISMEAHERKKQRDKKRYTNAHKKRNCWRYNLLRFVVVS